MSLDDLSEIAVKYQTAIVDFEEKMVGLGFGDYTENTFDFYDNSIEFLDVGNNDRLDGEQLDFVFSEGFSLIFLNHMDGYETIYSLKNRTGERKPSRKLFMTNKEREENESES